MPPLAIAGLAAVATIGGAVIGAKAQSKAANQASDAQLQVANQNNALVRELYGQNTANFSPYMQSGGRANSLLDSFIYGAAPQQGAQPGAPQPPMQPANPQGLAGTMAQDGFSVGDSFNGYTATNARGARNLGVLGGQQQPQNKIGRAHV